MATYEFRFTETPQDALDAYDAVRTASTGMRGWARFAVALYGVGMFFGFLLALTQPADVKWWQLIVWFAIGGGISWHFFVKPALIRRRLRSTPVQTVWVELSDAGIAARVAEGEAMQRYWGELTAVLSARKGLAIGFRDGTFSWLPRRAFAAPAAQGEVELFIKSKLPSGAAAKPASNV